MDGQTPATWLIEVDGKEQGPYTSQEVMKLVMDGSLKLESKICDTATNTWKIAADVVPYLELNAPEQKSWTPPPKPLELKDVHVVDLHSGGSEEIDYLALINERRRDTHSKKRTAPTPAHREPTAPPSDTVTTSSSKEVAGFLSETVASIPEILKKHRTPLSIAAALAFVFAGTYGVIRNLTDRKGREPANTPSQATPAAPVAPATSASPTQKKPEASVDLNASSTKDGLGSGHNRVRRNTGSVSQYNETAADASSSRIVPPMPEAASGSDANREPPQYYNTGDTNENQPPASASDATPQPPSPIPPPPGSPPEAYNNGPGAIANAGLPPDSAAIPPPGSPPPGGNINDPNGGSVNPPGFIPPPDPATDPNRAPTSTQY